VEEKIVDVEVISEKEYEKPVQEKPIPVASSDRSRQVNRYTKMYVFCVTHGFRLFLLFLLAGLAFAILSNSSPLFFILMIVIFSLSGAFLIVWLLGYLFRHLAKKNMEKDPNYGGQSL